MSCDDITIDSEEDTSFFKRIIQIPMWQLLLVAFVFLVIAPLAVTGNLHYEIIKKYIIYLFDTTTGGIGTAVSFITGFFKGSPSPS
jgi:hypothetical protein